MTACSHTLPGLDLQCAEKEEIKLFFAAACTGHAQTAFTVGAHLNPHVWL